jgi:hypothetical protein
MQSYLNGSGDIQVALVRGDERRPALIHWLEAYDGPRPTYWFQLVWTGPELRAIGPDAFEALAAIREQLEPSAWFVAVQGSRLDTYPSGMARDMGGGFRVYIMRMGQNASFEDLVDTFAEADPSLLATVAAQEEYWRRWRRAVPRRGTATAGDDPNG